MLVVLYSLFVFITLLLPGYALVRALGYFRRSPGIELTLAYAASLALYAALAVAGYVLKVDHRILQLLGWIVLVAGAVTIIRRKYYLDLWSVRLPLMGLVVMAVLASAIISLHHQAPNKFIPDPQPIAGQQYDGLQTKILNVSQTNANDNYLPYRHAQFFVNHSNPATDSFLSEWGVGFFQRTPLMGAVTASYFILLNDTPPTGLTWSAAVQDPDSTQLKFQVLAHFLNALWVVPGFFLLAQLFSRRTAVLALAFFALSQYFLYNQFFSWPKSFVAFFVLGAWLLLLHKTRSATFAVLAGLMLGLAYLAHDLAVLYLAATVAFLVAKRRYRDTGIIAGLSLLLALPWLAVAALVYHKPSSFIYSPFSLGGIPQPQDGPALVRQFFATSPLHILKIKVESLVYLLTPYQLLIAESSQAYLTRIYAAGLFSIPGSIGLGLLIPAFLGFIRRTASYTVWLLSLVPVVACVFIIGWPRGLGSLHFAQAVVVLMTGLAIHYVDSLKRKAWLIAAFAVNAAQLLFFIGYSYNFQVTAWLHGWASIAGVIGIVLAVVSTSYVFTCYALGKKLGLPSVSKLTGLLRL